MLPVTAFPVFIKLRPEGKAADLVNDCWTFADEIVESLLAAADRIPDLIILDYIYVADEVAKVLKARAKDNTLTEEAMSGWTRTPVDLREWVRNSNIDDADKARILKNLFGAKCPLYLHSYTPENTSPLVGPISERVKKTTIAFPNAAITSIDTREILFNNEEFDWPNPKSRYDSDYYPYQLAVAFDQIVQKEILRFELNRNRYIRLKRSAFSVGLISAIGAGLGFAGGWIGSLASTLLQNNQILEATLICGSFLIIFLIIGLMLPLFFEKLMKALLDRGN